MNTDSENKVSGHPNSKLKTQPIWDNMYFLQDHNVNENIPHEPIIYFVIKGRIHLLINDMEKYIIYPQEMFMIPEDSSYSIKTSEQVYLMSCRMPVESLFSEQILIDELIPQFENIQNQFTKLPIKKTISRYLALLNNHMRDGLNSNIFYELKRHELFLLLFAYYTKKELAELLYSILSKNIQFKKFVMNNYLSVKNVQELAALANYSTSGFIKKFQKYFNESPYQWMQKQKAKQILIEINRGVKSLQEIANEYKFSSYQHFAGFCKSQLGFPPTEISGKNRIKKKL
jgi:AraC-like DNA-binding protein